MNFIRPNDAGNIYFLVDDDGESCQNVVFYCTTVTTSFTLVSAWQASGCFLFLEHTCWDLSGLQSKLKSYLQTNPTSSVLWINDPNQPVDNWKSIGLATNPLESDSRTLATEANFIYRNYQLNLPIGSVVSMIDTGLQIVAPDTSGATFTLQVSTQGKMNKAMVNGDITIPFETVGALNFEIEIAAGSNLLDVLDVGLRFFSLDAQNSISTQRYPIFDPKDSGFSINVAWLPLTPDQSQFTFLSNALGATPMLRTYYRTTLGHAIYLLPSTTAKLVFALNPAHSIGVPSDPAYLVPTGDFSATVATTSLQPVRLMCGLSGVEYIELTTPETKWTFHLGQNACAGLAGTRSKTQGLPLTGQVTSAWVSLHANGLIYSVQPENGPLHHRVANGSFLEPLSVISNSLPALPAESGPCMFPLLPYAGLPATAFSACQHYEKAVIAPHRQGLINASPAATPPAPPGAAPIQAASPQGFLASFGADCSTWKHLALAKDNSGGGLHLSALDGPIKAAFQANRQFLLVTDPNALASYLSLANLTVAGWQFDLDPARWGSHNTILIFKFYPNMSVQDLLGQTSHWTFPAQFNQGSVQSTATLIDNLITEAQAAVAKDSSYETFLQRMLDPNWNGVIALNAFVPLTGLPPQIEGLAAGIDPALFYAHHVGFDASPCQTVPSGDLFMGSSAFFGLIDYQGPTPATTTNPNDLGQGYHFRVDTLKVEIENAKIYHFSSRIHLTAVEFFSEPAVRQVPTGQPACNEIVLQGSYQDKEGCPSYSFTTPADNDFTMQSQVLASVNVAKAEFVTVSQSTANGMVQVKTRFILSGSLGFQKMTPVDLFSYQTIPYTNLWIDMNFSPTQLPMRQAFTFDTSHLTLAAHQAQAFDSLSLVNQFPLKFYGFQIGVTNPASYANVTMPAGYGGVQSSGWYGLSYSLTLGSLGALAPKGDFTATLLLAWSPTGSTTGTPAAGVFLKLPGFQGTELFDLEGILKLGMKGIRLAQDAGACVIKFESIGLSFLSKTIPPGGSSDFYLFGDPGNNNTLAWYGAYAKTPMA